MSSFTDTEFLTSLFTMLNECIEYDPDDSAVWVEFIKKDLEIETIPETRNISSIAENPLILKAFNKNKSSIQESYIFIKEMYDDILLAERSSSSASEYGETDKEFLTSLFTMLNKCIEDNPDTYLKTIIKDSFKIDTIPTIQDIPNFIENPQVIKVFNKNKSTIRMLYDTYIKPAHDTIMRSYVLTPEDEAVLTSYFTMLNKCIEDNPNTYLLQLTKQHFKIDTILAIQDIPSFIADPQVIKVFNTNKNIIQMLYDTHIKPAYDKIMLKNVILRPSAFYIPIKTFTFGSVRQQNAFNQHFNRNSPSSMLLNVDLHGKFISKTPKVMSGIKLNKYNNAAPGQCTSASKPERKYIAYALSDAVLSGSIIDIPTIIREGYAYAENKLYEDTTTNKDNMFHSEITNRADVTTANHSGKVGEEITYGNSFFEKKYKLDEDEPYGVFLCKKWGSIEGNILDNLLANPFFILFMNEKYDKAHVWGSSRNAGPIENEYFGSYQQLISHVGATEMVDCVKTFVSSDLFEFCEEHGRPEISLIDTSCSVFNGSLFPPDSEHPTRNSLYDYFTHPKHANVAKGTRKGKKRKSRKCKGRKGKEKRCSKKILTVK